MRENAEDVAFRKFQFKCEEVRERDLLTNFHGMRITSDKIRSLFKKWQTAITANLDIKTTDGYVVRIFVIGFTKRSLGQRRKTSYAKSSQVKKIRKRMFEVIDREAKSCDLKELFKKLVSEIIEKRIEKVTSLIFPMQNCYVSKVKIIKAPKFELSKLIELHNEVSLPQADQGLSREINQEEEEEVLEDI